MSRDHILHKVRTALGRSEGQSPAVPPLARLCIPEVDLDSRIASFFAAIEKLAGKTHLASSAEDARAFVEALVAGKRGVASNAAMLRECGVTGLPGVRTGFTNREELRAACAEADFGITGADFALSDTGSLVLLSSQAEARMVSLLPPVHIALVRRDKLLTGLDELYTLLPQPADQTSSMVFITGPSRTADIEQILVRGVHGPGEIYVIVI